MCGVLDLLEIQKKKISNIICCFLFFICLLFSFNIVMILLGSSVLIQHDQTIAFDRVFMEPEHGRYVSTFITSLLVEKIPNFFSIHPNDFSCTYSAFFKSICTMIFCYLFSVSLFIFYKDGEDDCNILERLNIFSTKKGSFLKITFCLVYLLVFLSLFNDNYFFSSFAKYINSLENMVFFEYPMSMLLYIPFYSILLFYIVKNNFFKIDKKDYLFLFFITIFLTMTVELVIFPVMFTFSSIVLFYLLRFFKYKNEIDKLSFFNMFKVWICYVVFVLFY